MYLLFNVRLSGSQMLNDHVTKVSWPCRHRGVVYVTSSNMYAISVETITATEPRYFAS